MRIVKVKFLSTYDKDYSDTFYYKDTIRGGLKKYDTVIVPTRYGISMAVVEEVGIDTDEVRNKFSTANIKVVKERIKSKTVAELTKLAKVDDLKKSLEAEIKKIDEVEKYRVYADLNPAVAAMLTELEELRG